MIRRRVVSTRTYRPGRTIVSAFGIEDTLECGHVVYHKGSQGFAEYRQCRECQDWIDGGITFKRIGDKVEKWDAKTQMPYWETIHS